MMQSRPDGFKRFANGARITGQSQDQATPGNAGHLPREHGVWRSVPARLTHGLGQARNLVVEHGAESLRGDVSRPQAGAAGEHEQIDSGNLLARDRDDGRGIVGDNATVADAGGQLVKEGRDDIPAFVADAAVTGAGVADGDDGSATDGAGLGHGAIIGGTAGDWQPKDTRHRDRFRFDHRELSGAVADVGVFVPIAIALIVRNGLSPTAVLLPAGLLGVVIAFAYRLPIPVQPLKAVGVIAVAKGLGQDTIAAAALLMGVLFLVLGGLGLIDRIARVFPRCLVRGVQLTVGLLLLSVGTGLLTQPPAIFTEHRAPVAVLLGPGIVVAAAALLWRRRSITLALVLGAGLAAMMASGWHLAALGPSPLRLPRLSWTTFSTALVVLVLPQFPLSLANSCLATADAAQSYFGSRAGRVRPGRLAVSMGTTNLLAGAIGGMPVCHGAGGLTAHRAFGARSGGAPLVMGLAATVLALCAGAGLAAPLAAFPLPILGGLLIATGGLHIGLLRDLKGGREWCLALAVGAVGFRFDLALALALGLACWWSLAALEHALGRANRVPATT